jgi:hypothetical protein
MIVALAVILIINAVFSFVTWPAFYRRVAKDPRARDAAGRATRFLRVHVVLVTIALVLGVVSVIAAVAVLAGVR